MFNDKYGLTQAVLAGTKTMTRRIRISSLNYAGSERVYQIGERLAVAQSYERIYETIYEQKGTCAANMWWIDASRAHNCNNLTEHPGFTNKMYVKPDLMPHVIEITDRRSEKLQDISDEECLKEGVEEWLENYVIYNLMENHKKNILWFGSPRDAFATLINRISGKYHNKDIWDINPEVYAYSFRLIK